MKGNKSNSDLELFSVTTRLRILFCLLFSAAFAHAQLAVTVSPVKVTGQKAIVPLAIKNGLTEKVESARAVCFLLDEQGRMVGQSTKWVIGGTKERPAVAAGATNAFYFVIASSAPSGFTTTNLTAKVSFSRVVLEGGKLASVAKDVTVKTARK